MTDRKPGEPLAYMRKWAFDKTPGTPGNRPKGWAFHETSVHRLFDDDVPLYAAAITTLAAEAGHSAPVAGTMKTIKGNIVPEEVWVTLYNLAPGDDRPYLSGVSDKPWDADYDAPITKFADNVRYAPADIPTPIAAALQAEVERLTRERDMLLPVREAKDQAVFMLIEAQRRAEAAEAEVERLMVEWDEATDAAYLERNKLVALLASIYPSGIKRTAIPGWSEDWHGCVYINFPWGQASWHYHDSQADLFAHLPPYDGEWDGHTTEKKYEAIVAASRSRPTPPVADATEVAE